MAVVNGHEVVVPEEEVDIARGELVFACLEVDAVKDHVEIAIVRLDFRVVDLAERVLDRERMEVKGVGEEVRSLLRGRLHDIDPERDPGRRVEPLRLDPVRRVRFAVLVDVNGDHGPAGRPSPCPRLGGARPYFDNAACAAASRATGTR